MGKRSVSIVLVCVTMALGGCVSSSSSNGRETMVIGFGQIREGKGDTRYAVGTPADNLTAQPHLNASEADTASDAIRALYLKGAN